MKNLRTTREEKGLTQIKVCQLTGINPSYYSELERGVNKPNRLTRSRIEKVLGKIDWLETESIEIKTPNYFEAERKLKELVELTLDMQKQEKSAITKLVLKYFKPNSHKG